MPDESMQERQERSGLSENRRRELADFLRTRREKLKPEQLGITQVSRRRTPGLRREEVAEIAGVGTTWYTWLEQARDIQPSADVLKRLSQALLMNSAETQHLFTLAGRSTPIDVAYQQEVPSASLLRTLKSLHLPAILLSSRWDVLAVNEATVKTFPMVTTISERNGNWIQFFFSNVDSKTVVNWETVARQLISDFRLSVSEALDQPWAIELVDSLRKTSDRFDSLWREHDVSNGAYTLVEFTSGNEAGPGKFERTMLRAAEDPRLSLVIYNPKQ